MKVHISTHHHPESTRTHDHDHGKESHQYYARGSRSSRLNMIWRGTVHFVILFRFYIGFVYQWQQHDL